MSKSRLAQVKAPPRVALYHPQANRELLLGIAKYVREYGPWSIYRQPNQTDEEMPRWLSRWKGDGIIGRIVNRRIAAQVQELGIPFVDVLGAVRDPAIPLVHGDDRVAGVIAAEHLLERGFRHFGYYGCEGEIWSDQRRDAFVETVATAGGDCQVYEKKRVTRGPVAWDQTEQMLGQWLSDLPRPAAILGASDDYGERILGAARRMRIRVPDELAVIGVDNNREICELCDPPLSSVMRDFQLQGYRAAQLLDRMMNGESPPDKPLHVRPVGVVTRQSTDVLAIDDRFIAQAVSYIRRHACNGITVDDVLREVPLSRSVLQRRFRRILGQTVHDMIVGVRIRRAKQLLTETELSLSKVAEVAGFRHQQYLSAVFRSRFGVSAAQYRKQNLPKQARTESGNGRSRASNAVTR